MSQRQELDFCPNCGSEAIETSPVMGVIRHFDVICSDCELVTRIVGIHPHDQLDLYQHLQTDYMGDQEEDQDAS